MADVMRSKSDYGSANPKGRVTYPVAAATVIEVGDLLFRITGGASEGQVLPAGSTTLWNSTIALTREALAEKFVGVARVEAPKGKIAALRDALLALGSEGFHLTVEETAEGAAPKDRLLVLDLVGPDHPGIVRDISHCLAMRGVSVEEMETDIRAAPMGGGFLFYAKARVRVPPALSDISSMK